VTTWGVCDNANYPESTMRVEQLQRWGGTCRRSIAIPGRWDALIQSMALFKQAGLKNLVVFTTESAGCDFDNTDLYNQRLAEFCSQAQGVLDAVEIHNELDTPDWGITDAQIVYATQRGADTVHRYGVQAYAPSIIGDPAAGRFAYLAEHTKDDVDVMVLHPYFRSIAGLPYPNWLYGTVEDATRIVEQLTDKPIAYTEIGFPRVYLGMTEDEQAQCTLAAFHYDHPRINEIYQFCLNNLMVPGGEVNDGKFWGIEGQKADRLLSKETVPTFVLGFERWHNLEPELIGDAVVNERGPFNGMSQQLTTTGLLTWTALGFTFWHIPSRKMYIWHPDWQHSKEA